MDLFCAVLHTMAVLVQFSWLVPHQILGWWNVVVPPLPELVPQEVSKCVLSCTDVSQAKFLIDHLSIAVKFYFP